MSFIEKKEFVFTLTPYGKKVLAENGLMGQKLYYTFYDDDVIYTLNAYPNLIPDMNGNENKITGAIINRYNLIG